MTHLPLKNKTPFFSQKDYRILNTRKRKLTELHLIAPDWTLPSTNVYAKQVAMGGILAIEKQADPTNSLCHATPELKLKAHYTTPKTNACLMYAFEKFSGHISVLSKAIIRCCHPNKKGAENLAADQASTREKPSSDKLENKEITEHISLKLLTVCSFVMIYTMIEIRKLPCGNFIGQGRSAKIEKQFFKDVKHYFWDDPFLVQNLAIKYRRFARQRALELLKSFHNGPTDCSGKSHRQKGFMPDSFAGHIRAPRAINTDDRGTHFCNDQLQRSLLKYESLMVSPMPYPHRQMQMSTVSFEAAPARILAVIQQDFTIPQFHWEPDIPILSTNFIFKHNLETA
ncbi:hypothetical protein Tco_0448696 [Tanacetum coccineum]